MTDEANTRPQAGMDPPYCEICGEALATVSLADVGACNDCAEGEFQRELEPLLGYRPCATIIWPRKDMPALCLVRAGIEHDHA